MSTPAQIWGTTTSVTLDTSSPTDDHADTVLHSDHVAHPNQRSSRREGPGGLVLSALNSGVTMRAIPEPQGPPILRMTSSDPARKVGRYEAIAVMASENLPVQLACRVLGRRRVRLLRLAFPPTIVAGAAPCLAERADAGHPYRLVRNIWCASGARRTAPGTRDQSSATVRWRWSLAAGLAGPSC